jgi:hypothetical protein
MRDGAMNNLRDMLLAHGGPIKVAESMRAEFLPALIERLNTPDARRRLALYSGDRIPENERNLTDVRNRVSLIIEYELARFANDILAEHGITDIFWCYVVANRFPDLEVRDSSGKRHLRIEVKCLQSIAEEKSANFDTLKKDIHPDTDFVVVFVWEWDYDTKTYSWNRAPRILSHFVFHAYSLASLRDQYWLNRPPAKLAGGYQGFDLRYAVNCTKGVYNQEEGNYGKLLRIWQQDFPHRLPQSDLLDDTEREYVRFRSEVVFAGFQQLTLRHLPVLSESDKIQAIIHQGAEVGAYAGDVGLFFQPLVSAAEVGGLMREHKLRHAVLLGEKYACIGLTTDGQAITRCFQLRKPKHLARKLFDPAADLRASGRK